MQTCDTLLHAGVLLTQDDDRRVLENAALAIDGGRIVALGYSQDVTAAWQAREILDLSGMLVMPGLVNAHTHAAMTFLRGLADDMPLMDWLQQKIFPVEQGLTPDLVRLGSLLGFAEMLRTGTTSCVDMYIFEAAVLEAADKAGLRCLAGEGVFNFPSACCPDADAALACTREMAQHWAGHDRLHVAVMPHSVYTTTAAQLTACRELADELGLPLHIHLAETRQETALSLEQHGLRPVAHADRLGLLRPGTILAHVVDVDADEIALLGMEDAAEAPGVTVREPLPCVVCTCRRKEIHSPYAFCAGTLRDYFQKNGLHLSDDPFGISIGGYHEGGTRRTVVELYLPV